MSKWDRRMLGLVNLIATWSKDPSTGVGAVIVDAKNRVVWLGYNGFPRAVCDSDEALFDRDEKLRRTIHAEENALLFARGPVDGCTIYVTHPPCARCAAKLIQAVMRPGVTYECRMLKLRRDGAWLRIRLPSGRFLEAGVAFEYVEPR